MLLALSSLLATGSYGRPVPKATGKGGSAPTPQRFMRQTNNYSNMLFYVTNRGVLFNRDNTAGLYWPRGSNNTYIFGGGVWFATIKEIGGRRRKLCELGYNPNSGAGWYTEGEYNGANDGINPNDKYITYFSPNYDKYTGRYIGGPNQYVPNQSIPWPIWDTSGTKTLKQNYYFGDYISDVELRKQLPTMNINGKTPVPAMLSQEDIVNIYSDADPTANPEFKPNTGYPFFINVQEVIYSWSFGRYRDMIFVRHKVTNASNETLYECYLAPAFDPDMGPANGGVSAQNDFNTYVADDDVDAKRALKGIPPYDQKPSLLNMAYQGSDPEDGKQYGYIGFTFLESPAVDEAGNIIENSDSVRLRGYTDSSIKQLGLNTFKKWVIANDPPTGDLRYDFVSSGAKDRDAGIKGDMRLLFSTGPFTLPPGKSVETTIGIAIANPSTTTKNSNLDSMFRLVALAHKVFADTVGSYQRTNGQGLIVSHFQAPLPPELPTLRTQALDRAVLVTWDSLSDKGSIDPISTSTLPFLGYRLFRTTRQDHDSTIRPDGQSPVIKLGEWTLYDLQVDTLRDSKGAITNLKLTRKSTTPKEIPHSFLDLGDDNNDGTIASTEGLTNGVKYYYYLTAFDEYDTVNKIGPLETAIVQGKNFVSEVPTKPPFIEVPFGLTSNVSCLSGGITNISLEVRDTGRFIQLFANDTMCVKFQPRWDEVAYNTPQLKNNPLNIFVDFVEERYNHSVTYDELQPAGKVPYSFASGVVLSVTGQREDSVVRGRFSSDNVNFQPNQTIDQTFSILVDYQFTKLKEPYRIHSIGVQSSTGIPTDIVRISRRQFRAKKSVTADYNNLDSLTFPTYLGALGEKTYEVTFGQPVDMPDIDSYDTILNKTYTIQEIKAPGAQGVNFGRPKVLPLEIAAWDTSCPDFKGILKPIRNLSESDVAKENDDSYYVKHVEDRGRSFPAFSDPDTMKAPIPGKFAVDAYHFIDNPGTTDHIGASAIMKTIGGFYFPYSQANQNGDKQLLTVHRLRLAGGEFIINFPGIKQEEITGDTTKARAQYDNDFAPGDKITISFSGLARGIPFPDTCFYIYTSQNSPIKFTDANLYNENVLSQVQVVPNPYVVTHVGQTSTDNAKLFFTRLPPRATIEIYTLTGDLIKTIEHNGYAQREDSTYNYDALADRSSLEEWNLLSEGRQRVGSQVLIARIIAKDPNRGDAVIAETTTKFAIVLGGYRIVR